MGSYKTSRVCNVPQTTLQRYVKDRQKSSNEAVKTKVGRKQFIPCEAENDLAEHNGRRHASRLPTCCKKRN